MVGFRLGLRGGGVAGKNIFWVRLWFLLVGVFWGVAVIFGCRFAMLGRVFGVLV